MKLDSIVLTLAGIAGIAAFFLPYITLEVPALGEITVSGMTYAQSILNAFDLAEKPVGGELFQFMGENWAKATDFGGLGKLLGVFFVCLGPVFIGLYSLGYIFRGIRGKQYKRGIFFILLFTAASWAIMFFIGKDFDITLNFFKMANIGFWVGLGAMVVAAFSLFFAKNLDS